MSTNGRPAHVRIPDTEPKPSIRHCVDCGEELDDAIVLAGYGRCPTCQKAAMLGRNQGN